MGLPRTAAALLTGVLVVGGVVLGAGTGAASVQAIDRAAWSSIDSATPAKTITGDGDARIGTWFDEQHRKHVTKAYFTFDLSGFSGATIQEAGVFVEETAAADCSKPRATQLWVSDPAVAPTWNHQPRQRTQLPGPGAYGCPSSRVEWDATAAMQQAVAAGETTMTLVMTMPKAKLISPAFARSYDNHLRISVTSNRPPDVPANLQIGQFHKQDCGATPLYLHSSDAGLSATVTDPDGGSLDAEFSVWPVDQPDQPYTVTSTYIDSGSTATIGLPSDFLVDGKTYDWHVRALDGTATSAWSPTCRFGVDDTPPATAPTITSTDYPQGTWSGGAGIPGEFTFDANDDPAIAGFYYSEQEFPTEYVSADHPGGTATVTVTPGYYGPHSLYVVGVDQAGNRGPTARYDFLVKQTAPTVRCARGDAFNKPITCTFTPSLDNVVSYTYTFGNNQPVTITAQSDGSATAAVVPQQSRTPLTVTSTTADGTTGTTTLTVFCLAPQVSLTPITTNPVVNEPVSVKAAPGVAGTVSYTYRLDDGEPMTVAAGPDGTATITVVPTTTGWHTIFVQGATAENYQSAESSYNFYVPEP